MSVENTLPEQDHQKLVEFGDVYPYTNTENPSKSSDVVIMGIPGKFWIDAAMLKQKASKRVVGGVGTIPIKSIDWSNFKGRLSYEELVEGLINVHALSTPVTEEDREYYTNLYREDYDSIKGVVDF